MTVHDATEIAYKNGYEKGFADAESRFVKKARASGAKKYLLTVLVYLALVTVSLAVVCAKLNMVKKEVVEEIKKDIAENVEPKVLNIIEKEDTTDAEMEAVASKKSLGEFKLTAYCSCEKCCGGWAKNRPTDENGKEIVLGSVGKRLFAGRSIAVDPAVIPYGSIVEINGKEYSADDCGGAIKGNRIDVYFENHDDALVFGVQYAEVFMG